MILNFIKFTWRHFIRNPFFSLINIVGLTVGITAALLILLLILHEKSYDNFHEKAENIYRVGLDYHVGNTVFKMAICMTPLGPELQRSYPEVESYTRISKPRTSTLFAFGEKQFYEDGFLYADSGFFKTLSFNLIQGNPDEVLKQPYSIVLSSKTAEKYFGNEDPVGKMLRMNNEQDFTITGVAAEVPSNSHIQFDMLASFSTHYHGDRAQYIDTWTGNINYWTYLRVSNGFSPEDLERIFYETLDRNARDNLAGENLTIDPIIHNIQDIYLHSDLRGEMGVNSSNQYVILFMAIAIFILAIASINYMNLSTAQSSSRAKEVGIKKVVGANRPLLTRQFLFETFIFIFVSLVIAMILLEILLPAFNNLMGKQLKYSVSANPGLALLFVGIVLMVGLLSGSYPAFYLSSFIPIKAIKGELFSGKKGYLLRNILVITQFSLATILIIGSFMVMRQVDYIHNKDLGFNKEQIIIAPLRSQDARDNYQRIKEELGKLSFVLQVSASQNYPGRVFSGNGFVFENLDNSEELIMSNIDVDEDFIDLYEMKILSGRNFSREFTTDDKALVINEKCRSFLGLDDPLGEQVTFNGIAGYTIIGMVNDFHFASLHNEIEPLVISARPHRLVYLNIKIQGGNLKKSIRQLEKAWTQIDPDRPFDYFFLDQTIEQLYENELRTLGLFKWFTILAILIALMGLFGLSSFLLLKRTKEIGIRKSLGATSSSIGLMFTGDFLKLILIANLIALPAGYFGMKKWLQNFEYHAGLAYWIFIFAIFVSFLVALLTVLYHSLKASRNNPVDSLRYE